MELISHGLLGSILAGLGFGKKYKLLGYVATVVGSIAPDLDILTFIRGPKAFYKYHREITHSLLGSLVLAILITLGVYLVTPFKEWPVVFAMVGVGIASHLVLDSLTPWGLPLFYPFTSKKYSFDLIWFYDPVLIACLVGGAYMGYYVPGYVTAIYLGAITIMAGYLLFRVIQKRKARWIASKFISNSGDLFLSVLPSAISPFLWDVIFKKRNKYIHLCIDTRKKEILSQGEFSSGAFHRCVKCSQLSEYVEVFLKRSRFPFYSVTKDEGQMYRVEWNDVHLANLGGVHGVVVHVDGDGQIIKEKLRVKKPVRRRSKPQKFVRQREWVKEKATRILKSA